MTGSISSGKSPTSFARPHARSKTSAASSCLPTREGLGQPERAREEGAFVAGQPVVGPVSQHEFVVAEIGPHSLDGREDALVASRQEAHHGKLEQRRIHRGVVERAHEGAPVGVDPMEQHRRAELVSLPRPFGDGRVLPEQPR